MRTRVTPGMSRSKGNVLLLLRVSQDANIPGPAMLGPARGVLAIRRP
jgi:hypothetical protein